MCHLLPQARLARLEQEVIDGERTEREEAQTKIMQIENAERDRSGPVDDSNLVDEMFGFIAEEGAADGAATGAFKASYESTGNKGTDLREDFLLH